jgi:hypothetical protein
MKVRGRFFGLNGNEGGAHDNSEEVFGFEP